MGLAESSNYYGSLCYYGCFPCFKRKELSKAPSVASDLYDHIRSDAVRDAMEAKNTPVRRDSAALADEKSLVDNDLNASGDHTFGDFQIINENDDIEVLDLHDGQVFKEYVGELPPHIAAGYVITIRALPDEYCYKFSVALKTSRDVKADIGLYFAPHMVQKFVERNCRIRNVWGRPERSSVYPFPFKMGEACKILMFVTENNMYISVNNRPFCAFVFRLPFSRMKFIEIRGRLYDIAVSYRKADVYPEQVDTVKISDVPTSEKLTVPFLGSLNKPLKPRMKLQIWGRVKLLPHSFYINLQGGDKVYPHPTVALHLNPRFCTTLGHHFFVRNSWVKGAWGEEEVTNSFPFVPGCDFFIEIETDDRHFTIWSDGKMVGSFGYRTPLNVVNTVYIQGDITLNKILFVEI